MKYFLILLLSALPCVAHEWKSIFVESKVVHGQLVSNIQFDASIVDPETKDDPTALARKRSWLVSLNATQHQALRKAARAYLVQCFAFSSEQDSKDLASSFHFPDWQTSPPNFPKTLDSFAYFSVTILTDLPKSGTVSLRNKNNDQSPTINLSYTDTSGAHHSHLIEPDKKVSFLTTSSSNSKPNETTTAPIAPSFLTTLGSGLYSGFIHVLPKGYDHILFILALCLFSTQWKHIIQHSLLFTLTHSVTFILLSLQVITLSDPWRVMIEIIILTSILTMAVENLVSRKPSKRRLYLISLFGLVHGLGFASAFGKEMVATNNHAFTVLIAANLGIEAAQLVVILALFLALFKLTREIRFKANLIGSALIISLTLVIAIATFL